VRYGEQALTRYEALATDDARQQAAVIRERLAEWQREQSANPPIPPQVKAVS
jgi:hypothetical protein